MGELEIPQRARRAACDAYDAALDREARSMDSGVHDYAELAAVEAAAAIVVAAELLEHADLIDVRALKAKPGVSVALAQEARTGCVSVLMSWTHREAIGDRVACAPPHRRARGSASTDLGWPVPVVGVRNWAETRRPRGERPRLV